MTLSTSIILMRTKMKLEMSNESYRVAGIDLPCGCTWCECYDHDNTNTHCDSDYTYAVCDGYQSEKEVEENGRKKVFPYDY